MADGDAPLPHPGLAEAERRVRAAIAAARATGDSSLLALRHAELGMILAAGTRHTDAAAEYRTSLGYLDLLRADGTHEDQRLTRITSLSAPPPKATDFDLERMAAEVRVALVESLVAAGDLAQAQQELQRAQPLVNGFFRRRLRKRLQRAAAAIAAGGVSGTGDNGGNVRDLQQHLSRTSDPGQQRALRLRLANTYLDAGQFSAAARESLLLVASADEAGDVLTRAGARQVLGLALEGLGRPEEALPILSDAFRDLKAKGDDAGLVGMAEALAQRLLTAGDTTGAATVLRTAQKAAQQSGDTAAALSAATMLGVALDESGDRGEAVQVLLEAADRAGDAGHLQARADALHSAAVALGGSPSDDDLVEALSLLDEAKRIYADHDLADRVAGCDHEAAAMLGRHGSFDASQARYRTTLQAYEALPTEQRDTGSWPDEVADCRANLDWLDGDRDAPPVGAFRSGGHGMTHAGA